jgi:hypothetical protein
VEITCALLCDAATVREGLLHILGGGVTRLNRSEFPAPIDASLAIQVSVHPTEAGAAHEVELRVLAEDGEMIVQATAGFAIDDTRALEPGEHFHVPIVLPMNRMGLPRPGGYSVEILIEGQHKASVPFRAVLRAEP